MAALTDLSSGPSSTSPRNLAALTDLSCGPSSTSPRNLAAPAEPSSPSSDRSVDNEFRTELLELIKEGSKRKLENFMMKAEEHPKNGWHKVLLSHLSCVRASDTDPYDPHEIEKLIDTFPDVLQRVLLQDPYWTWGGDACEGQTVLHAAVLCGHTKIVALLTDHSSSREQILKSLLESSEDGDGFTAIRRALLWRHLPHLKVAQASHLTIFLKKFETARSIEKVDELRHLIHVSLSDNKLDIQVLFTVFMWACASGTVHIIREFENSTNADLFQYMVQYLEKKRKGFATLVKGAGSGEASGLNFNKKSIKEVLTIIIDESKDKSIATPVVMTVKEILHKGTSLDGKTLLHLAAARGEADTVDVIMDYFDKIWPMLKATACEEFYAGFSDDFGMTPLHYAVLGNHKEVVERFMISTFYKPLLNKWEFLFRRTAFHLACSKEEIEAIFQSPEDRITIIKLLMENPDVDVNTKDCFLFTALHWAVHRKATEAVRFLVSRAGERTIRTTETDIEGRNPYEIAAIHDEAVWKRIQNLLLMLPEVKDEVERFYRDRQVFVDAANAILVGAALIASVTFGGWLQPPLGENQDLTSDEALWPLHVFWAFSSLSFFFAVATVMVGAGAVLPMANKYIGDAVSSIRRWLSVTSLLLILSIVFVLGAFTAAGFASLSGMPGLTVNMTVTSIVGNVLCITGGLFFMYRLDWTFAKDILRNVRQWLEGRLRSLLFLIVPKGYSQRRKVYLRANSISPPEIVLSSMDGSVKNVWGNLHSLRERYGKQDYLHTMLIVLIENKSHYRGIVADSDRMLLEATDIRYDKYPLITGGEDASDFIRMCREIQDLHPFEEDMDSDPHLSSEDMVRELRALADKFLTAIESVVED